MFLPVVDSAPRPSSVRFLSKRALLSAGVSAVALFVASQDAFSRSLGG